MNKRGAKAFGFSIFLLIILITLIFLYFVLFNPSKYSAYAALEIKNPIEGLSDKEALAAFDESFIFYLLYNVEAYKLHNPPLSSDNPRMEIDVGGEIFGATVMGGLIEINRGRLAKEDILIKTTKEEAIKMIKDKDYIAKSFNEGGSSITLSADKTTLLAKGYLNLYNQLTGKSITGNLIRIFSD